MLHNVLAETLDRPLLDTDEVMVDGLPYPLEIGIRLGHARKDNNRSAPLRALDGISESQFATPYSRNAAPVSQTEPSLGKQLLGSYRAVCSCWVGKLPGVYLATGSATGSVATSASSSTIRVGTAGVS